MCHRSYAVMEYEDFIFVVRLCVRACVCVVENCIEKGQLVQMGLIIIPAIFFSEI